MSDSDYCSVFVRATLETAPPGWRGEIWFLEKTCLWHTPRLYESETAALAAAYQAIQIEQQAEDALDMNTLHDGP